MTILRKCCAAAAWAVVLMLAVPLAQAQMTWQATLGAQSKDLGKQAMAFLPNEMWIHAGDSITWTSQAAEMHTVTFLVAGQPFPPFVVGCPNYSPSGASFNGTSCVSAPPITQGQSFTVKFPVAGNFSLLCLVHPHMTGVVHVLPVAATLPYDQAFYNAQAQAQTARLLRDADAASGANGDGGGMGNMLQAHVLAARNGVVAGIGEMSATAGGYQSLAVMRFLNNTIRIHAGDTVEWSVLDPATPHTITFGPEPANTMPPSGNVSVDADGARHATLHFVGESVHSGFLQNASENRTGVPQPPPGVTVFRVTFLQAGTYDYTCALHDALGMVGKVIVEP